MSLEVIASQVESLFAKLDAEIASFQQATTLHCGWGCGKCCFKADIEATALEFLPFALHLYREGLAEAWYDRLKSTENPICLILNPTQQGAGLCSEYKHRGLICRLFGYSARTNKHGGRELVTCAIIKSEQAAAFTQAEKEIEGGLPVPVMSQYYFQLMAIDADLSREFYPINVALRKAIEAVMHYYAYR
jgi:Fe-S-cluster containining protein